MSKDLCSTTKSGLVDLSQNMSEYLVGITTEKWCSGIQQNRVQDEDLS